MVSFSRDSIVMQMLVNYGHNYYANFTPPNNSFWGEPWVNRMNDRKSDVEFLFLFLFKKELKSQTPINFSMAPQNISYRIHFRHMEKNSLQKGAL